MLIPVATCFALILGTGAAHPWELVDDDDGVKVWARPVADSEVREVKAETIVDAPAARIWETVCDVEHYAVFMPYIEKVRVVGKHDRGIYVYQRINPPFVDRRDYTVKVTYEADATAGRYKRSWEPANDKGPPPREDSVRLVINEGHWQITAKGPTRSAVVYYLHTDPGGSIPNWLANKGNKTSVPNVVNAVRNRSIDPKWRP